MTVNEKTVVLVLGLVGVFAAVLLGIKIRADRADAKVDEIFDQTEIDQLAVMRETFGPWIAEVDNGDFGEPVNQSVPGLDDDPRMDQVCSRIVEIENKRINDVEAVAGAREDSILERAEQHESFLLSGSSVALYGALYDQGWVSELPPNVPYSDNTDRQGAFDFDERVIASSGKLDGLTVFDVQTWVLPLTVLSTNCVIEASIDGELDLGESSRIAD